MSELNVTTAAKHNLVLASASPRRIELLRQIGVEPQVCPADIDETQGNETAQDYTCRLALAKAATGAAQFSDKITILGADTTVVLDGETFGKPADVNAAEKMLLRLSGRTHQVFTAIALIQGNREMVQLSATSVRFRDISVNEIRRYWHTGEPAGKAGSYAIQGLGAIFVEHITGSYSGVMGLPLFETAAMLKRFGVFEL